jgi:hypothetical protein
MKDVLDNEPKDRDRDVYVSLLGKLQGKHFELMGREYKGLAFLKWLGIKEYWKWTRRDATDAKPAEMGEIRKLVRTRAMVAHELVDDSDLSI